jgi:hypothetical protein
LFQDVELASDALVDSQPSTLSSPTLSVSTIFDFAPTEIFEAGKSGQTSTRHNVFYLEDGNVEILCGTTIFRIHTSIVSFSSSKLRDILSKSALLNQPTPEGCPRIIFQDSAEDFAVLLKMISTPG